MNLPQDALTAPDSFAALGLSAVSLRVVGELGYEQATAIQVQAIPVLLQGQDLVGQSATGSGKTAAFGLAMLERLDLQENTVQGLVLCPTRELAAQVGTALRTLGRHRPGLRVLVVAGGQPSRPQRQALQAGVHVVVGTPGRVLDLLDHELDFAALRVVVLDEADRMLDMGFLPSAEKILTALPEQRQTVLFSATMPAAISAVTRKWQRTPVRVKVIDSAESKPQIRQWLHAIASDERASALDAVLGGPELRDAKSVLIFCNFKESVRNVASWLGAAGHAVEALHGDLEQRDRDRVLVKFRNGSTRILVATDVAARGLDIAGIDAVINYELPPSAEVYVHRIGRTGRAGAEGLAISLATEGDGERLRLAEMAMAQRVAKKPLPLAKAAPRPSEKRKELAADQAQAMLTLLVRGGRKDKIRAGDILGALSGEGGVAAGDIGRIEIGDDQAYVAVAPEAGRRLVAQGRMRIKGRTIRIELLK